MPNKEGKATKGHTFLCMSCGLSREYIGSLVLHIRNTHHRKVSAPEYLQVTERQALTISEQFNTRRNRDRAAKA